MIHSCINSSLTFCFYVQRIAAAFIHMPDSRILSNEITIGFFDGILLVRFHICF